MDRRAFLRIGGTGLVAAATMQEVGIWAEIMDWLRRAPAWSFPTPSARFVEPLYDEITAATLAAIRDSIFFDNFFVDTPRSRFELYGLTPYNGGEDLLCPITTMSAST